MVPARIDETTLLEGVRHLAGLDPELRVAIERDGPPPLWAREPGFETLVQIILEQQVSLASGRAAHERLVRAVGRVSPEGLAAIDPAVLVTAGITRQKVRYLQALGGAVADGSLELDALRLLDDAAVRSTLCAIPGIGAWTADVYLLMALGRPDAWPAADVALMTAMARLKGLAARATLVEMAELAEPWRPWRAVAARILWHAYLAERRARS